MEAGNVFCPWIQILCFFVVAIKENFSFSYIMKQVNLPFIARELILYYPGCNKRALQATSVFHSHSHKRLIYFHIDLSDPQFENEVFETATSVIQAPRPLWLVPFFLCYWMTFRPVQQRSHKHYFKEENIFEMLLRSRLRLQYVEWCSSAWCAGVSFPFPWTSFTLLKPLSCRSLWHQQET